VSNTLRYSKELDYLIDQNQILIDNPRLDCWLAKVLITELLWGKKELKSNAKPVETILNYKTKLQESLGQFLDATVDPYDHKKGKH
jgi:putative methyltransferase